MSTNIFIQRICQHCGKEFTARTTVTKYCSAVCNKRDYKAKKRAEKIGQTESLTRSIKEKPIQDLKSKEYLSLTDASNLLGLSRWTLWRAIKDNRLSAAKIGRSVLIKRASIDELFELPIIPILKEPEQRELQPDECYTISEVLERYTISDKALNELIKRNNIQRLKKGRYTYVPKNVIDTLLGHPVRS